METRKFIQLKLRESLNESSKDFSGEYRDLYNFINDNNLEQSFVDNYKQYEDDLTLDNWDDFVRGEIDSDEEIILNLIGNNYRVYYSEDEDIFVVTKNKEGSIDYKVIPSNDKEILNVIEESGIYSDYEPRFAVISNGEIIGGSTYEVDEYNVYNFDIGILDEYQGYGISKKLITNIISDAKKMGVDGIKAQVVNEMLFDYLTNMGFKGSIESDVKFVYLDF